MGRPQTMSQAQRRASAALWRSSLDYESRRGMQSKQARAAWGSGLDSSSCSMSASSDDEAGCHGAREELEDAESRTYGHGIYRVLDEEDLAAVRQESRRIGRRLSRLRIAREKAGALSQSLWSGSDVEWDQEEKSAWTCPSEAEDSSSLESSIDADLDDFAREDGVNRSVQGPFDHVKRLQMLTEKLKAHGAADGKQAKKRTGNGDLSADSHLRSMSANRRRKTSSNEPADDPESTSSRRRRAFKARPVPASTLLPMYEEMTERMRLRRTMRKAERKQALEDSVFPFKGMEMRSAKQAARRKEALRKSARTQGIIARGLRRRSLEPQEVILKARRAQEADRKRELERQRIKQERSQRLLRSAKAPFGLYTKRSGKETAVEEFSFKPKVNAHVPDFERQLKSWEQKLKMLRRAKKKSRTNANVDDLSMFGPAAKARQEQRKAKLRMKIAQIRKSERSKPRRRRTSVPSSKQPHVVMTKAEELRLEHMQEKQKQRAVEEKARVESIARKKQREIAMAKKVRAKVLYEENQRKAETGYTCLEEAQRRAKEKARQMKQEARTRRSNDHHESTANRSLLLEQHVNNRRKSKRRQEALVRVASVLHRSDHSNLAQTTLAEDEQEQVDLDTEPIKK